MTVIAPSLVSIASSLGATLAQVGWVMAIYATGSLIAQPIAGKMSDARGRRRVFIAALIVFSVGSVVCALSTSLGWLIAGRVVQSLGAGALQPAAIAIVGEQVPQQRQNGALYAIYGMFALAGALGAVIGGLMIDGGRMLGAALAAGTVLSRELTLYPWHLIFWINLPIAAGALLLALRLPADREGAHQKIGIDTGAIILISAIAFCLMTAANGSATLAPLWLGLAVAAFVVLPLWEKQARYAFFEPSLFTQNGPRLLYTIAVLTGIPIFSVTMYSAAYYMTQFHASAAQAGIALLALALPLGAGQGVGSRLARRMSARLLLIGGLAALTLGELALAGFQSEPAVLIAFAIIGFGIGVASAPPNALMLRYVDPLRSGAATGLLTMLSSTGAISAPAAVSAFLHYTGLAAAISFRFNFGLACVLAAISIPLAMLLPEPG